MRKKVRGRRRGGRKRKGKADIGAGTVRGLVRRNGEGWKLAYIVVGGSAVCVQAMSQTIKIPESV